MNVEYPIKVLLNIILQKKDKNYLFNKNFALNLQP